MDDSMLYFGIINYSATQMKYLNLFKRKSYYKQFMEQLSSKDCSFSWDLVKLESKYKTEEDPSKRHALKIEMEKVASHKLATKKMVKATRLHDSGRYQSAADLYKEVIQSGVYYANLAEDNLAKIQSN